QPSAEPARIPSKPAARRTRIFFPSGSPPRSRPPASSPSTIVARDGMKLRVRYPPSLKTNGRSRGNRFRNHWSKPAARLVVLSQHLSPTLAASLAGGVGECDRHSRQEGEGGLDQVPEAAPDPFHVIDLIGQELPDRVVRESVGHLGDPQPFGGHQQHHEAPVG